MSYKIDRLEEDMKRVISEIISQELKDPGIKGLISITKIKITPDLKFAKIYTSVYGAEAKDVLIAINKSAAYIRKQVSQRVKIRNTPELNFVADDSMEYGAHMNEIIKNLK